VHYAPHTPPHPSSPTSPGWVQTGGKNIHYWHTFACATRASGTSITPMPVRSPDLLLRTGARNAMTESTFMPSRQFNALTRATPISVRHNRTDASGRTLAYAAGWRAWDRLDGVNWCLPPPSPLFLPFYARHLLPHLPHTPLPYLPLLPPPPTLLLPQPRPRATSSTLHAYQHATDAHTVRAVLPRRLPTSLANTATGLHA